MSDQGWIVKFVPFTSAPDSPFWVKYCEEKLERIRLSEEPIELRPSYADLRLRVDEAALSSSSTANERVSVMGELTGFNTLETFQTVDKNQLLSDYFVDKFLQGRLDCLTSCVLLTYADLKSHKIVYWFGFPALVPQSGKSIRAFSQQRLGDSNLPSSFGFLRSSLASDGFKGLPPFFIYTDQACLPLSKESYAALGSSAVFGFVDPVGPSSTDAQAPMGWPMRNLVAYLCFHLDLGGQMVQILSYRPRQVRRLTEQQSAQDSLIDDAGSLLLQVQVPTRADYGYQDANSHSLKVVGWELNARNKPGPRSVNLRPLLDAKHLAMQAADLNLKLMKWRQLPDLNVDRLQATKVLIIGAGTLGCSVARVLLGWGIRKFKFVDYGKVSYSNPVRQSLFTLEDCRDTETGSGRLKSPAAAEALQTIAADVESEGIVLSIPMPGHVESRESIQESVEAMDQLVEEADVVFLLTDTRESRWLPTVMAAAKNKLLINAALGLDSWLVMRHGAGAGHGLGCYFCNDVVAPENSMKNRTLDQQCTVTRPGLAPIASSMAVELMVALWHHPDGAAAPAPASSSTHFSPTADAAASPLGAVPHQIRGSIVSYTMMTPTVPAFAHCTACSARIVEAYRDDKLELVYQTCQSTDGGFLETISGLTDFRAQAAEKFAEMEDWEEDDE